MENEQIENETEYCNNCKKDIPSVNFVMHSSHCSRNIMLCDLCNEPVPISEKDEHFEESHVKVKCECGKSIEKMNLDTHKESDCKSRKVVCEYCELELPFSEMKSHKEYCGSRTELCDKCNKYIKQKDLEDHLNSDCQADEPSAQNNSAAASAAQNRHNMIPPADMIQNIDFREGFGFEADALRRLLLATQGTLPEGHYDEGGVYEYGTLYDAQNMYPQDMGPRNNVVARGPQSSSDLQQRRSRRATRRNPRDFDDVIDDDVSLARNQPAGDELILTRNQLERDELMAALLACEQDGRDVGYPSLGNTMDHLGRGSFDPINPSEDPESDAPLDQTVLPCEFCGEAIQAQDLILHQTGCQLMLLTRASSSGYPNLRSQPHSLPPIEYQPFDDMVEQDNQIDDDDQTFLPCEFCQELVKSDFLFSHQSMCDPQQTRPSSVMQTEFSYETEPERPSSNNSRPRPSARPPRPSRPVVDERLEERDFEIPLSTGSVASGTTVPSSNANGFFIPRNNRNESYISDLLPPTSQRHDNREIPDNRETYDNREMHATRAHSNGAPLTIHNQHSSKTSSRKEKVSKKTVNAPGQKQRSDFTRPTRATEEPDDTYEVALPRRGSQKKTSSRTSSGDSTRSVGLRGVQETQDEETLSSRESVRSTTLSSRYSNGTKSGNSEHALGLLTPLQESSQSDEPLKVRPSKSEASGSLPLSEKNKTSSSKASVSRKKIISIGQTAKKSGTASSEPFQHTQETRKQLSRLVPNISAKPQASTDSRRQDVQQSQQRKTKSGGRGREEEARPAERRNDPPNTDSKPRRSRKKIV